MDQRMTDVEGGRAVRRGGRAGRQAAVVAAQSLLVVACLLLTGYLLMHSPAAPEDVVYIQLKELKGLRGNAPLEFEGTNGHHMLENNKGNITVRCTGPYVWHMNVCYQMVRNQNASWTLALQVKGTPVSSFTVNATQNQVCRGLHSIVYLRAGNVASVHLRSPQVFWIQNVNMGLSYLLGNKCDY